MADKHVGQTEEQQQSEAPSAFILLPAREESGWRQHGHVKKVVVVVVFFPNVFIFGGQLRLESRGHCVSPGEAAEKIRKRRRLIPPPWTGDKRGEMEPGDLIRGGFGNICLPLFGSAWLAVITGRSVERSVILISNRPLPPLLLSFSSPPSLLSLYLSLLFLK